MFLLLWEFRAREGRQTDFEEAYGPEGVWAQFFRKGNGFVQTILLHDSQTSARYITIDTWKSEEEYESFRKHHAQEYAAIDSQCESLTASEHFMGSFQSS